MKGHLLRCIFLAVILALAFGSTLKLPFFMDDYLTLRLLGDPDLGLKKINCNAYSTQLIPEHQLRETLPWWADPGFRFHYFRPFSTLIMAMDMAVSGGDPEVFHRTSLLLHILCALLLYGFSLSMGLRPGFALLAGLMAGLHANHLFSVSWVCNRDNTLGAIFLVALLWAYNTYLKNREDPEKRAKKIVALGASLVLFILGILSKENVVLAPWLLFVLTLIRSHTESGRFFARKAKYLPLVPFFVISLLYVLWYGASGHGVSTGYLLISSERGLTDNLAILAKNLYLYLVSLVLFVPPDFKEIQGFVFSLPFCVFTLCLLALLTGLVLWKRHLFRVYPALWLFLIWMFLFLFTPLWFIPLGRLLYTSILGFSLFAGLFLQGFKDQMHRKFWRVCLVTLFVLWFVLLPLGYIMAASTLLVQKGDEVHLQLDRGIAAMEKELPEGASAIFLLNAPNPASVYIAGMVHAFHHPESKAKVYALGNRKGIPTISAIHEKGFCLQNPEGILNLEVTFPRIPLEEGKEIRMPAFQGRIRKMKQGPPEEVCFTFPDPLDSPGYLFLTFENGSPRRVDFNPESGESSSNHLP